LRQTAYRFVFENRDTKVNFTPVALQDSKRCDGFNESQKCMSLGLSFFDTANNAEVRFRGLRQRVPQIHKKLGYALAQVEVTPDHGLATKPDPDSGHFTLHEFSDARWTWRVIKALV
jgi:hypothetical protein